MLNEVSHPEKTNTIWSHLYVESKKQQQKKTQTHRNGEQRESLPEIGVGGNDEGS